MWAMDDRELTQARIFLRPIANPMALGFVGVAVASLLDSGLNFGWYPLSEYHQAALVIAVFAPLTLVIACVFGFLARDPVASTGLGVQAASWLVIGLLLLVGAPGEPQAVLGTLQLVAGVGLALVATVAISGKALPAVVMITTATRWVIDGVYQVGGGHVWQDISGVLGLVVCAAALYSALALELEDQRKRTLLPTGRRGDARSALEPHLRTQTDAVAAEAGVRSQL